MTEVINNGGPAFPGQFEHGNSTIESWSGMTLRQYAAIKLKVPNSGTDWLDEMIRESLRVELAARVMQGLISDANSVSEDTGKKLSIPHDAELIANASYAMSDAMLKAREMK